MPRRKIAKTPPETLAAFKAALSVPRHLSAEEEEEFQAFRRRAYLIKPSPIRVCVIRRRGRYVFRVEGQAGADFEDHPQTLEYRKRERDFLSYWAKQAGPPIAAGVKARQSKAEAREREILRLLEKFADKGSGAAAVVARELRISAKQVREVRNKNARDGGTGFDSIP